MSLRYGRLLDGTVRAAYERALTLAEPHIGRVPPHRTQLPITDISGGPAPHFPGTAAGLIAFTFAKPAIITVSSTFVLPHQLPRVLAGLRICGIAIAQ